MKFFTLSALVFSALQVKSTDVDSRGATKVLVSPPTPSCADPRTALPFFRGSSPSSGDHLYTANETEFTSAIQSGGYISEGVTGYVFSSPQTSTIPLYRLWSNNLTNHFYTISASERSDSILRGGYDDQGIAGYVYPPDANTTAACGGIGFWRLLVPKTGQHFYTSSTGERDGLINAGYTFQSSAGYVLPY